MQLDANEVILKKDFMAKRSQIRKYMFLGPKYRGKWFILTPNAFKYYDGSIETGPKRVKGEIRLSSVLAVETVDGEFLDNRPYAFQVVYKQNEVGHLDDKSMIYVISVSEDQKIEWIQSIYEACHEVGCQFSKLFHRGVWLGKCYSCCSSINQRSEGCQPTTVVTAKVILEG
ncbi:hypothetical protein HELRODRAFT_162418 [Helobdella robusta]|uniref:PH domain-containing protein n=1 Tax=Helobdella robusta TaxID=6412 RepID=T1ESM5_HELRO|nr:hypothetical protein HELRODRAFT_162418 [Helobdella robusta]ESN98946.1 hypothetical protein HELRODRAFT_162418 [Helobdella robusta]